MKRRLEQGEIIKLIIIIVNNNIIIYPHMKPFTLLLTIQRTQTFMTDHSRTRGAALSLLILQILYKTVGPHIAGLCCGLFTSCISMHWLWNLITLELQGKKTCKSSKHKESQTIPIFIMCTCKKCVVPLHFRYLFFFLPTYLQWMCDWSVCDMSDGKSTVRTKITTLPFLLHVMWEQSVILF